MTELNFTLIMPLIGVIVGGVIGATSSFFAGYISDRRKHRMELFRLRFQKLEEATCALSEVFDGCANMTGTTYMKARWNTELPVRTPEFKSALAKVSTVISVYFPEIREAHKEFVQSMGELAVSVFEMTSVYDGNDIGFNTLTEEQKNKAVEYIVQKACNILDTIRSLESQFQKIADELTSA